MYFWLICTFIFQVCGKAFNSRDNRNAHRFVHSDKKPYECLVCGMGFMRKPQLYNHMQTQVTVKLYLSYFKIFPCNLSLNNFKLNFRVM